MLSWKGSYRCKPRRWLADQSRRRPVAAARFCPRAFPVWRSTVARSCPQVSPHQCGDLAGDGSRSAPACGRSTRRWVRPSIVLTTIVGDRGGRDLDQHILERLELVAHSLRRSRLLEEATVQHRRDCGGLRTGSGPRQACDSTVAQGEGRAIRPSPCAPTRSSRGPSLRMMPCAHPPVARLESMCRPRFPIPGLQTLFHHQGPH